jgi:uncharacterized membrane protein YgdD (TMEM256/DUF423 family)
MNPMNPMNPWIFFGAVLGGVAVAAGSFGAHGLADLLEANGQAANWETAVRYAMFHALAMLVVGVLRNGSAGASDFSRRWLGVAGGCFLAGSAIFSGFLAALALSGVRILGAIVPIGGVLLLLGWAALALAATRLTARSGHR